MRATALVLALALSSLVAGAMEAPGIAAASSRALAADNVALATEDVAAQSRTVAEAYNLLLDHYAHSLDTAALLRAGWEGLSHDADGKAPSPGQAPPFSGDRGTDLELMRAALTEYSSRPGANGDGFVPAHAIVRGMVRYVDEGHTYFLDQQQYRDYQAWSRGDNRYVGIGVTLSTRTGEPHIVEVYEDTPARAAGLQAGDVILNINDKTTAGMAGDELTNLVRGPVGSPVRLFVRRGDDPTPLPFSIPRAEIHLQFVRDRLVEGDIAYVSLRGFPEPSVVDAVERSVAMLKDAGAHSLVLDLRGNAGGRIDVGARLLGDFLPAGTGMYEEVSHGGDNRVHVTRPSTHIDLPLVVLVDGGTASMGEIFASAVQEHSAATVLGSQTSGSVAAAQVFPLPDGAGLQVTVFDILSSEGKTLNRVGVHPDEVIQTTPADGTTDDAVLARAVDLLHDQIAASGIAAALAQP
ncbi:MAG: S41 family peptidase [Chloroflexota bacterium]